MPGCLGVPALPFGNEEVNRRIGDEGDSIEVPKGPFWAGKTLNGTEGAVLEKFSEILKKGDPKMQ